MKKIIFTIIIFFIQNIYAQFIINEIIYDPPGTDSGNEWIELYNNSKTPQNIKNWSIEKAGTSFSNVFTFTESLMVEPNSIILVGEKNIKNCDYYTNLSFQNGGSATDGVRIVSPNNKYYDTILYDFPNTNKLPDDENLIAKEFLKDINEGSYARKINGYDSNNLKDWFHCINPTPGKLNITPVDLEIKEFSIINNKKSSQITAVINNLSTGNIFNKNNNLSIFINEKKYFFKKIPLIKENEKINYTFTIKKLVNYSKIEAYLDVEEDININNNYANIIVNPDCKPFIFNELMIKPDTKDCEWIEIFSSLSTELSTISLIIVDNSERMIKATAKTNIPYQIICQDKKKFLTQYSVDSTLVIQANSWTLLNNSSETLLLKDKYNNLFDSLSYNFSSIKTGISYERVHPNLNEWMFSTSTATPTKINSVYPAIYDVELENAYCKISNDKIKHFLKIKNKGLKQISEIELNIKFSNFEKNKTFNFFIELQDSIDTIIETPLPSPGLWNVDYYIFSSADENDFNNHKKTLCNNNYLPLAINEIMFNPNPEEPEWIEFKINDKNIIDSFNFFQDGKSKKIISPNSEYFIMTNSSADSLYLRNKNVKCPILMGLNTLSNSGENLGIFLDSTKVELFSYDFFNESYKGKSIERIDSHILSTIQNWKICPVNSTPGYKNSVSVDYFPSTPKIKISPNPFSPYKNEICTIKLTLPERINIAKLDIFDLKGRKIKTIRETAFSATDCTLFFDGKNNRNKNLLPGIYFIYLEVIGESNKSYKNKKIIVIAK